MKAKCGRCCPVCDYYKKEEVELLGLKAGWYRETMAKLSSLVECDHTIPDELGNTLLIKKLELEGNLKEVKAMLRMVKKAKDEN